MNDMDQRMLAAVAAVLGLGRGLDRFSRALTVAALIGLVALGASGIRPSPYLLACLAGVSLAGLVAFWFALRVALDAALFDNLARAPDGMDWRPLDAALIRLRLLPPGKAGRPTEPRIMGAWRLFRCQAAAFIAQLALAVACAVLGITT